MGNQVPVNKTINNINPNINKKQIDQPNNKKKYTNLISSDDLVTAFKYYSIGGKYLNNEKFNESIKTLLKFDLPLLPYTYLSEKLFELLDKVLIEKIIKFISRIRMDRFTKMILLVV